MSNNGEKILLDVSRTEKKYSVSRIAAGNMKEQILNILIIMKTLTGEHF
ncbi:MAG: hypothetical protein WBH44_07920 [Proteocatella sp.]